MRAIDMSCMQVVTMGLPWRHALSPCSKQAIGLLERNTKIVTWLMPKGGCPTEQVPAIRYKDKFFSLSLRMQKAIYRHIRLKKGFQNEETVNGMQKLRIPDLLLKEKMRTQSRFDAMRSNHRHHPPRQQSSASSQQHPQQEQPRQQLPQTSTTSSPPPNSAKKRAHTSSSSTTTTTTSAAAGAVLSSSSDRSSVVCTQTTAACEKNEPARHERSKGVNTVAARMKQVVDKMIQSERAGESQPQLTLFLYQNQQLEITNAFFQEFQKENRPLFRDRNAFFHFLSDRYSEYSLPLVV